MNMKWTMKHNEIHVKHKRHICYTHNHTNLMKQSRCLSLILCQDIQWRNKVSFPQSPRSYQPTNPLQMVLHTINILCREEIERPRVGEFLKSLQNGDGKPTISYRCSVTKMTNCLGDRLPSFATWIESKLFKICLSLLKKWSVDERAHLEKVANGNFAKRRWIWPFSLYASRPILYAPHQFGGYFEALVGVQNVTKCVFWKA